MVGLRMRHGLALVCGREREGERERERERERENAAWCECVCMRACACAFVRMDMCCSLYLYDFSPSLLPPSLIPPPLSLSHEQKTLEDTYGERRVARALKLLKPHVVTNLIELTPGGRYFFFLFFFTRA
jgi:hypothetical protein